MINGGAGITWQAFVLTCSGSRIGPAMTAGTLEAKRCKGSRQHPLQHVRTSASRRTLRRSRPCSQSSGGAGLLA